MKGYLIARINVSDPQKYEKYKALAPAAIAAYGGKYLTRGGVVETLEGEEESNRIVILEFESLDMARKFYHSPEYGLAKAEKVGAAEGQYIITQGL